MQARNITSGIIGTWINYWIPSMMQESMNKKLGLDSKIPTLTSSANAVYTAGIKTMAGFALVNNSSKSLDDPKFVAGTSLLISAGYSLIESYYRTRLAIKHDKPIPGLIIYGLENLLEQHDDKILFIAQNNKVYANRL